MPYPTSRRSSNANDHCVHVDQNRQRIKNWLFAILRFAITREESDRAAVLSMAAELDRPGYCRGNTGFAFFVRTSATFCDAIMDMGVRTRTATLRGLLVKIEDHRLRRAIEAAADMTDISRAVDEQKQRSNAALWKGLPR